VKAGRAQGAKIVSRVVEPASVDEWMTKIEDMQQDIDEVLQEEKEEKQLAQAEMQVTRGTNLINHDSEIMARPRRTWFESEKEKQESKKLGRAELNGTDVSQKKEKRKLSGKDKKRLDDTRERKEGKLWKKGKDDKPVTGKAKRGKKPTKKRR
jgi:ATP-dependent RNA helicase DDX27